MTISQLLAQIDAMKPNHFTVPEKVAWMRELDSRFYAEAVLNHEGSDLVVYEPYNEDTPEDTELLLKPPHDECYIHFLSLKIDLYNMEIAKYNSSLSLFTHLYDRALAAYTREHMPKRRVSHFKL